MSGHARNLSPSIVVRLTSHLQIGRLGRLNGLTRLTGLARLDGLARLAWRLKAANGKIVADSSEGYSSKHACREGIDLVRGTTNIPVVEDE